MTSFDENGKYIKTNWKAGDKITATKLNKIEESIEAVNDNDISRHVEADARLDALEAKDVAHDKEFTNVKNLIADNKAAAELGDYDINSRMTFLENELNEGIEEVHNVAETVDGKIATAEANMTAQIDQGKADMEAMVAEVEADLEGLHAKDEELSEQLVDIETKKPFMYSTYFGINGDGTDETEKIQNAIDFCSQNNYELIFEPFKQYKISKVGEHITSYNTEISYSLVLKENSYINFNNSCLYNEDLEHSSFLYNYSNASNIKIINLIIDMSNTNQQYEATPKTVGIGIYNSENVYLDNIKVKNFKGDCIELISVDNFYIDNIKIDGVVGHGLNIGKPTIDNIDYSCKNGKIGKLSIFNQNIFDGVISTNPFIASLKNTTIDYIHCEECAWGVKLQGDSDNVYINKVMFICGENQCENTGFKIQQGSKNIECNTITVYDATKGYPIYIDDCENININNINVYNSLLSTWFNVTNCNVNLINTINSGRPVYVRETTDNLKILSTNIKYDKDVTENIIVDESINTYYGDINIKINDGIETPGKVLVFNNTDSKIAVNNLEFLGTGSRIFQITSKKVKLSNMYIYKDEEINIITKLGTGSYTNVSNANILYRQMTGGFYLLSIPTINVLNSNSNPIKSIRITDGNIRIYHDASLEGNNYVSISLGKTIISDQISYI